MRIEITQLPPVSSSPNWRGHWASKYQAARVYHNAVFYTCVDARNRDLLVGKSFPMCHAKLDLTFVFPQSRRRDKDNMLARFKPGLDAIKDAGLILDDDSEHLEIGEIDIRVDSEMSPLTIIKLTEAESEETAPQPFL